MPPIEIPALKDYSPGALDAFFGEVLALFEQDAAAAATVEAVEQLRIRWIGRKQGLLTRISELLKGAPPEARREAGIRFNTLKSAIEPRCDPDQLKVTAPVTDAIDITLPGTRPALGAEHPLVRTMHEIVSVFAAMGYSVGLGPEVETDYYNFESLNFPPGHPARDTQDTLVVANQERKPLRDRLLMRTHTSPVQIHTMEQNRRRCALSSLERCTATMRQTLPTPPSSTRLKDSAWTPTSPSPISRARSTTP